MSYIRLGTSSTTCSLIPSEMREEILLVVEPIRNLSQAYLVFLSQVSLSLAAATGPLIVVTGPVLALNVLVNSIPYILLTLAIDCNVSNAAKNEAKAARANIRTFRDAKKLGLGFVPGVGELSEALDLADAFLVPVEKGQPPSAALIGSALEAMEATGDSEAMQIVQTVKQVDKTVGSPLATMIAQDKKRLAAEAKVADLKGKVSVLDAILKATDTAVRRSTEVHIDRSGQIVVQRSEPQRVSPLVGLGVLAALGAGIFFIARKR